MALNKDENNQKKKKIIVPLTKEEFELFCNLSLDRVFFFYSKEVDFAISFLTDCLPDELINKLDLNKLEVCPLENLDGQMNKYYMDMLYRVPYKDGSGIQNFYTILEHKSYPDRWTMFQGFEYAVRVLHEKQKDLPEYLPTTVVIIDHQGKNSFSGVTNMRDYFSPDSIMQKYAIQFPAIVFDTSPSSPQTFRYDPNVPHKDLVLKMMRAISEKDLMFAAERFLEEINQREINSDIVQLRRVFLVSLEKIAKMNLDVVKNLEKTTIPQGVEEMSVFEQMMLEGREEGREEGARNSLIFLLNRKFKKVPQHIISRIEQIRDLTVLQSLNVSAAMCQTIQEFESEMV